LSRHRHLAARRAAAALRTSFDDYDEYLGAIRIRVDVQPYGEPNRQRVAQMLQKSNQFNLTTRRYTEHDLDTLYEHGATIGVFSYEDVFGSQGVIAAIVLVPEGDRLRIDSWVMSCRVLNRTVEQAIGAWMTQFAGTHPLLGEFIATDKNGIVRDLYARLGFRRVVSDSRGDHEWWERDPSADTPPTHLIELRTDTWDQHDGQEQDRRDRDRRLPDAVPPARSRAA
jgi:FkbH-like protein